MAVVLARVVCALGCVLEAVVVVSGAVVAVSGAECASDVRMRGASCGKRAQSVAFRKTGNLCREC